MSDLNRPSRRALLQSAAGAAMMGGIPFTSNMPTATNFIDLIRFPDIVRAFGPALQEISLKPVGEGVWSGEGAEIRLALGSDALQVTYAGHGVSHIQLRWHGDQRHVAQYMGDHWERSYGDLQWQGESPNRVMPWYFLTTDHRNTHGYGVKTGAGSLCFWTADREGISLWADVRSGGVPVELGDRSLVVAEVICRPGASGESAFSALQAFCRQMCPAPRLPSQPVYGTNDWNYAYGKNSAELIGGVAELISELSPNKQNRPFSVIDEGWAMGPYNGNFGHGPWEGNPHFGDMGEFAQKLKSMAIRPGLWFRPLTPLPDYPQSWRLSRNSKYLDPTVPDVKHHVSTEIKKIVGWGYELIKHDFTTWDLLGGWGFEMGPMPTVDGWRLHDRSKTNAEVLSELYGDIRQAAGSALLIGCNTVGHLAAGTHELQRIGDDTSGRSWNRNRRMGVNTLAFRGAQHGAFYDVDPDIVAITKPIPWFLVEQWLRLVSESGAALFVAVEPSIVEPKHRKALTRALELAAEVQTMGEPINWTDSLCPDRWKLLHREVDFKWMGETGSSPFPD